MWSFTHGETEYQLSIVPCGGHVLPAFDSLEQFDLLPLRKRVLFALGGPLANLLGATLCPAFINVERHSFSFDSALFLPAKQTWHLVTYICGTLPLVFRHPAQLSGLVGTVAVGGQIVGMNILRILKFTALMNVNLAVFNLLPILPLDGGKIVMGTLQKLYRPLQRIQLPLAIGGWALLVGLMLYVTVIDVVRIIAGTTS